MSRSSSVTGPKQGEPKAANGVEATRVTRRTEGYRPHQPFPYLNRYLKYGKLPEYNKRARKRLARHIREQALTPEQVIERIDSAEQEAARKV